MLKIQSNIIKGIKGASTAQDLHQYLQSAIELEHATIPTYLTAKFSLKPNTNNEIRKVLHSIVVEEMLHMTIACNILNALGGSPDINKKDFVPNFPGPLPMNIGEGLIVGLEKYSKEQVKNVFMEIEEPEDPVPVTLLRAQAESAQEEYHTIGEFYEAIKDKINQLDLPEDNKLPGDPTKQVVSSFYPTSELFHIIYREDALKAIDIIVEQGEGAPKTVSFEGEKAHYYKFYELYMQQTIHRVDKGEYVFGQPSIPFDENGVYNIKPNTKASMLPEGSEARANLDEFNQTYSRLLNGLHITFNGTPHNLNNTLGLMFDIKLFGEKLCATPFPGEAGVMVGPSFEFVELPVVNQ